ncbi:MAG: cobyric acid synthase [Brachymonas sp.]|nr:cobyric acid synthase [Brachymonas sp.]
MVLGCTSGAGKSWLTTALCRWYARQGYKVAPFKAQNMSNNARVAAGAPNGAGNSSHWPAAGGEIGSAQYFQALAAGTVPDVRMNPLLLKPEADTRSQVVLLGQVDTTLSALPWRARSQQVWPAISAALHSLRAENDVVVIEGAGSPAEINLSDSDVVNLRVARHTDAACLLVADIDRGGAFAHLYGTWALLPEADRRLLRGFVLNKFRGDASLLPPAPQRLQELTGLPTLATLPLWREHGLPEEDGVFDDSGTTAAAPENAITIAIIAYPRISNLDEFQPLKHVPNVRLRWVRQAQELNDLRAQDWIILPGSKATVSDLHWLRQQGLDAAICRHAAQGGRVLGICGGLQMLGKAVVDTEGVETPSATTHLPARPPALPPAELAARMGCAPGLGLLPLATCMQANKTVCHTQARFADAWPGPWAALAGLHAPGYEIHMGHTQPHPDMLRAGHVAQPVLRNAAGATIGWINGAPTATNPHTGHVLGLYLHGLFEHPAVLHALLGHSGHDLEATFNRMADLIETSFGAETLLGLLQATGT